MQFFSSRRERRFWIWAAITVVGIFTTLGLARSLVDLLIERELLDLAFVISMFLIGGMIVIMGLQARPGGIEIGVALGVGAVYLLLFTRMALVEERSHLIEYGVLAALIYEALGERAKNGKQFINPALLAWLITAAIGWLDEGIQAIMPSRVYDIRDVGFNAGAALIAIAGMAALHWARQLQERRSRLE